MQAAAQLYSNAARAHITAQLAALIEAAAVGSGRLDGGLRSLSPPDMSGVHAELHAATRLLQVGPCLWAVPAAMMHASPAAAMPMLVSLLTAARAPTCTEAACVPEHSAAGTCVCLLLCCWITWKTKCIPAYRLS